MRARTQQQWRGGFEGRGTGYGALVPVQRVQKVPLAHVPDLRRSVHSRAASAQSAQGARLGGCDEVCGESWPDVFECDAKYSRSWPDVAECDAKYSRSWPDVAECDAKYSGSCASVPNGCAKPSQAKPSQAKPSQAKPSKAKPSKAKHAFPYKIYLGVYK